MVKYIYIILMMHYYIYITVLVSLFKQSFIDTSILLLMFTVINTIIVSCKIHRSSYISESVSIK